MSNLTLEEQQMFQRMQEQLDEMQKTVEGQNKLIEQQNQTINTLQTSVRNIGGNLRFLRDLVEESVHLTEQTSGIVVEHVTTLDNRMNSVATIFTDKIKRELKELGETNLMESVVGQVELDSNEPDLDIKAPE